MIRNLNEYILLFQCVTEYAKNKAYFDNLVPGEQPKQQSRGSTNKHAVSPEAQSGLNRPTRAPAPVYYNLPSTECEYVADDIILGEQPLQQSRGITNEDAAGPEAHSGLNQSTSPAIPIYENRPNNEWEYVEMDTF